MNLCGSGIVMPPKVEGRPCASPRVLLVEDNALIAMDLEDILKNYGCEVSGPSTRVQDALDALHREDFDVALVDYFLEDSDAQPIARILNAKGIPFAFCTGACVDQINSLYPHTPILAKPFNPDDVSAMVHSLIASRLDNA